MKKKFVFLGCLLFLSGCAEFSIKTEALVLVVNENVLEGKLIGAFLRSPSGYISDDVNKISLQIEVFGELFLQDFKVSHATLAYFRNEKQIPLELRFTIGRCYVAILRERIGSFYVTDEVRHSLHKKYLNNIGERNRCD